MLSAFKTYRRRLLYTYHKMDVFFAGIDTIKFCKGIYGKLPKPFEDFKTTQTLYQVYIHTYISSIHTPEREEPAERQHLFLRFNQMVNALLKPKYTIKQKQNFKSRYYYLQQIKNNSLLHVGLVKVEIFIIVLSQVAIELS